jgi:hypothetical protein
MSNYLNETMQATVEFAPIVPKKIDWIIEEKRIVKAFEFSDLRFMEAFIVQLIKYNREANAEIEFRVKKNTVGVIIYALSPTISEIELEAKVDIDKIKKDVMYYYAR